MTTTTLPAKPGTDVPSDRLYRLTRLYIETISTFMPAELDAHRLLHVLSYLTFQDQASWKDATTQPDDGYTRRCVEIRDLLGLTASKGNRALSRGIEALREMGQFAWIELAGRNEWLRWRFDDSAVRAYFDQEEYAALDVALLTKMRSVIDYHVVTRVALSRRMWRPRFQTNIEEIAIALEEREVFWTRCGPRVLSALQMACARYGLTARVCLGRHVVRPGFSTIEVRLDYPGSGWSRDGLDKTAPEVGRVYHVDAQGHRKIDVG